MWHTREGHVQCALGHIPGCALKGVAVSDTQAHAHGPGADRKVGAAKFHAAQNSPEFAELKRRFRSFVFPMTLAFLVWYFLYVVLAVYATDFMSTKVFGEINLGLVFGLLQFVSTFVITAVYIKFAGKTVDPRAAAIRAALENGDYR